MGSRYKNTCDLTVEVIFFLFLFTNKKFVTQLIYVSSKDREVYKPGYAMAMICTIC